jgi:beta-lactamase regulating signal transducer with metallopeptidase domain
MIVWFVANVVLTMLALAFVQLNARAPYRLRFLVSFFALCCWLVPWRLVGGIVPAESVILEALPSAAGLAVAGLLPSFSDSAPSASTTLLSLANLDALVLVLFTVGALLFAASSIHYRRLVRRMTVTSVAGDHLWSLVPWETLAHAEPKRKPELRIQSEIEGAMTTGVLMPRVWVHKDLVSDPKLSAALIHEHRHVRNHDNVYLWTITLIEKLFWWNPLPRHLASRARRLQELSCDAACAQDLPSYRNMLAGLVLRLSSRCTNPCPQTPCIHHSGSFNIERLRALERRYAMRIRHYFSSIGLLIGSVIVIGWAAAQDVPEPADAPIKFAQPTSPDERQQLAERYLGPAPGFEPGTTLADAERMYVDMRVYATLLEQQFARQAEEIDSLRRELEALKSEIDESN